ncbi:MAG: hypothetical protein ACOC3T_02800 [Bacteroidota bacterium]
MTTCITSNAVYTDEKIEYGTSSLGDKEISDTTCKVPMIFGDWSGYTSREVRREETIAIDDSYMVYNQVGIHINTFGEENKIIDDYIKSCIK